MTSHPDDADADATRRSDGVRQTAPSADLLARSTLAHVDYQDTFVVDVGSAALDRTAEEWARTVFEGAAAPVRAALVTGWQALGLRLGRLSSDQHVLGWALRCNEPDSALLAANGSLGISGELLFERQPDTLMFATFVRLDYAAASTMWATDRPVHERVVPQVLSRVAE